VPGFFARLADFEFVRFEPFAFLEGDIMVAVPVRLELVFGAFTAALDFHRATRSGLARNGRPTATRSHLPVARLLSASATLCPPEWMSTRLNTLRNVAYIDSGTGGAPIGEWSTRWM